MSKKGIFIITIVIVLIGSMVIVPLIDGSSSSQNQSVDEEVARFDFNDNLDLISGDSKEIYVKLFSSDLSKIEIFIEDSLLSVFNSPKEKLKVNIDSKKLSVGSKELRLLAYKNDKLISEDSRLLRVLSEIQPELKKAEVVNLYPHNTNYFTQGLEFDGSDLFEGTGQQGESILAKIDLNGNTLQKIDIDPSYFGEGITIFKNLVYQITWQQQKCLVYNKKDLSFVKQIEYNGEGWGLCHDDNQLIMSDGSERLYFRNPTTFEIIKTLEVYDNQGPITNLNELEFIDGKIYANVWQQNFIVIIDPTSGKVLTKIDCSNIVQKARGMGEVLNGIAYQGSTKKLYLTGKNWSNIAEVVVK